MAGKYYQRIDSVDYDLTTLCAPRVHDSAPGFGTKFTGEGEFQKAGTDTVNVTLDGYTVDGSPVTTVKNGYYPSFTTNTGGIKNCLWWCGTPGSYSLVRSDTELKITTGTKGTGDLLATFSPSDFHGGVIPSEFIFFLVGGGGGGGGCGYFSPGKDNDGFVKVAGGAGGGGGLAAGRIRLVGNTKASIFVGAAGHAGKEGTAGQKSNGGPEAQYSGSGFYESGDNSTIYGPDGNAAITAGNGDAGVGGRYDPDNEDGCIPGRGGYAGSGAYFNGDGHSTSKADYSVFVNVVFGTGGKGNSYGSWNNTASSGLTYTPTTGTGAPAKTLVTSKNRNTSNFNNDPDYSSASAFDASKMFYSGGCSLSYGDYFDRAYSEWCAGGYGGGGTSGKTVSAGQPGYVEIWY